MDTARTSWKAKAILSLLWLSFVLLWLRVYRITGTQELTDSIGYLLSIIFVYALAVGWWIYHNVRIHRKKGPRLHIREVQFQATRDSLKRPILCEANLKHDQQIHVIVAGGRKVFIEGAAQPQFRRKEYQTETTR